MTSKRSEFTYLADLADQAEGSEDEAERAETDVIDEDAVTETKETDEPAEPKTDEPAEPKTDEAETDEDDEPETEDTDADEDADVETKDSDEKNGQCVYVLQTKVRFDTIPHRICDVKHIGEAIRRHLERKENTHQPLTVLSFLLNSMEDSVREYHWTSVDIPVKVKGALTEAHVAYLKEHTHKGSFHVWSCGKIVVVPPWVVGEERKDIKLRNAIVKAQQANVRAKNEAFKQRTVPCAGNYGQVDTEDQFSVRFPTENVEDFEFRTVTSDALAKMESCKWYKSGYFENYHGNEDIHSYDYFSEWPDSFVAYLRKVPITGREEEDGFEILDSEDQAFLFGEAESGDGYDNY